MPRKHSKRSIMLDLFTACVLCPFLLRYSHVISHIVTTVHHASCDNIDILPCARAADVENRLACTAVSSIIRRDSNRDRFSDRRRPASNPADLVVAQCKNSPKILSKATLKSMKTKIPLSSTCRLKSSSKCPCERATGSPASVQ